MIKQLKDNKIARRYAKLNILLIFILSSFPKYWAHITFAPLPIPIRSTISMKNNWPPMDDADNSISPKVPSIMVSALKEADEKHIGGKDVTPFLLDKVKTITEGKSLASNIELVYNNAKVAANIAKDLASLNK